MYTASAHALVVCMRLPDMIDQELTKTLTDLDVAGKKEEVTALVAKYDAAVLDIKSWAVESYAEKQQRLFTLRDELDRAIAAVASAYSRGQTVHREVKVEGKLAKALLSNPGPIRHEPLVFCE